MLKVRKAPVAPLSDTPTEYITFNGYGKSQSLLILYGSLVDYFGPQERNGKNCASKKLLTILFISLFSMAEQSRVLVYHECAKVGL